MRKHPNDLEKKNIHGILPLDGAFFDGLRTLSGRKALEKVLNHPDCPRLIRSMSSEDFYFLIKKVGAEESLDLLKLGSLDHWQYLLDLESWQKDRFEVDLAGQWIGRLLAADSERLTRWLFSEGQGFAYYYLYRSIAVEVKTEDEDFFEAGPEFFTIDGFFYVRPIYEDQRDTIESLLRAMAYEDPLKYQALLTSLAGVLPAELEEEMYRMRNVRLAEHGFLPREEAISVYAPLKPESLKTKEKDAPVSFLPEDAGSVPRWPLQTIQGRDLLSKTIANLSDETLLDRIRLEFAGLCNQIASAEGLVNWELENLQEVQLQAAGYLNLILRERSHEDIKTAESLIRMNSLLSLFRAGYGLVLNLKWKAQRWLKECWFHGADLEPSFWGEAWGGVLTGLLKRHPLLYCGEGTPSGFRNFQSLSELATTESILELLNLLDRLMRHLTREYPFVSQDASAYPVTVHQLLFTLWARQLMVLEPGFKALSLEQARTFLSLLRAGDSEPPYRMFGFEEKFLKTFAIPDPEFEKEASKTLKSALNDVWRNFSDEMESVSTEAFHGKYSKYILITPG